MRSVSSHALPYARHASSPGLCRAVCARHRHNATTPCTLRTGRQQGLWRQFGTRTSIGNDSTRSTVYPPPTPPPDAQKLQGGKGACVEGEKNTEEKGTEEHYHEDAAMKEEEVEEDMGEDARSEASKRVDYSK